MSDLAEDAAHDFARAGFREAWCPLQPIGASDGADFFADPLDEFFLQRVRRLLAQVQRDIGVDALALDIMRGTHDSTLSDFWVGDEGAFDLCRAHPVAGYVDDVVNAARDPVVAILIPPGTVAREVSTGICGEIGFDEALVIAVDRAHLPGPAIRNAEIAFACAVERGALCIHHQGLHAKEWVRGGARFQCRSAGQRRNENAAGFCLPPRIDNRAALIADDLVIPEPSFWIDRLANGP